MRRVAVVTDVYSRYSGGSPSSSSCCTPYFYPSSIVHKTQEAIAVNKTEIYFVQNAVSERYVLLASAHIEGL
jgi:hypothetical protein